MPDVLPAVRFVPLPLIVAVFAAVAPVMSRPPVPIVNVVVPNVSVVAAAGAILRALTVCEALCVRLAVKL